MASIEKMIDKLEELPSPDFIVQRIISLASDPNTSARELAEAIMIDASLSAKILKLANSAYYGIPRKITVLNEAIMILGFKTVRNLAMSVFTYGALFQKSKREDSGIDRRALWRHFVYVAVASETLGEILGYPVKEELFMNGLLHDIGKVALDVISPKLMKALHKITSEKKRNFIEAENLLEVPSHTLIGAKLVEKWLLPEMVVQSVSGHHNPDLYIDSINAEIIAIVHIADVVINIMHPGDSLSYGKPELNHEALNILSLKPKILSKFIDRLKDKLEKVDEFINM